MPAATSTLTGHSVLGAPIVARRLGHAGDGPTRARDRRDPRQRARRHRDRAAARSTTPSPVACGSGSIDDLNPDGARANTRGNAHGVDLNRNFAWRWRPRTAPGTTYYAGHAARCRSPRAASRGASSCALRPDITIWFHQSETAVDNSSGSTPIEARFARRVALPLRRLIRYPGSATTWQAHRFPKATAFVVELPPGALTARATRAYARAVLALARDEDAAT